MNVSIQSYGRYQSDNYGAHTQMVRFDNLDLYFSYSTVVAFATPSTGLVVTENIWGPTTGKHLNWISPYSGRIPYEDFQEKLGEVLKERGLKV